MGSLGVSVLFAASTFSTGYGEWYPGAGMMAALTRDEERYVERAMQEYYACPDDDCRSNTAKAILDVINYRRKLNAEHIGPVVFDNLRSPCERMDGNSLAQRDCFKSLIGLSFEAAMERAGLYPSGVTMTGFYRLRTGMREKEITYILGVDPVTISYSSYGGYSAEMLRYSSGRRNIIVTLTDDEMTGKAQSGLD